MSHGRVNHPSKVLHPGDDHGQGSGSTAKKRISLGIRRLTPDPGHLGNAFLRQPWSAAMSITGYHAFVEIEPASKA
jgi:ribosomal protein S1